MDDSGRSGRELEEDHDLLTFNESAARLGEEIARAQAVLDELKRRPDSDERSRQLTQAGLRLDQLELSQERNSRQAAEFPGARGFLDYSGPGSTVPE